MGHRCDACLVTCEDFRLHRRPDGRDFISGFIAKLGVDCDVIARAGAIHDFVHTQNERGQAILRSVEVAVHLHGVKTIHLVNHQDCGAYGHFAFAGEEDEFERHREDLLVARDRLMTTFRGVRVQAHFARLVDGTEDEWEMIAVVPPN